jgi:acetyl-CoA carboxylase biotin carboxylase subunit
VRLDSGVYAGWTVPIDYDSMLAKLAVWSSNRAEAIARMRRAIGEYRISGIHSNLPFFDRILADQEFRYGQLDTGFIERFFARMPERAEPSPQVVSLAASVAQIQSKTMPAASDGSAAGPSSSPWLLAGRDQVQR